MERTTALLRAGGCVAAEEEAADLIVAAGGDMARLDELVSRRCRGEPAAWLIGSVTFCGEKVLVHRGVYVPRWQSEPMVLEAVARLPRDGLAVDVCTGSGAIAVVLSRRRPGARVLATETDEVALRCARANGVDVYEADLARGLPEWMVGRVDVVTAVVPYVPTADLVHLPRDVLDNEPRRALDGGRDGTDFLSEAIRQSTPLLRAGGSLLLEVGGDEAELLGPLLRECGFNDVEFGIDEDGDLRALYCRH